MSDYLTTKVVSAMLGFSEETILSWAAPLSDEERAAGSTRSVMPSYRLGGQRRFKESEIMDWLAGKAEGERVPLAEVRTLREAG